MGVRLIMPSLPLSSSQCVWNEGDNQTKDDEHVDDYRTGWRYPRSAYELPWQLITGESVYRGQGKLSRGEKVTAES